MPTIRIIDRWRKVRKALELFEKYPGLYLDIGWVDGVQYSMEIKHPNYQTVCEFVEELYSADLVSSE